MREKQFALFFGNYLLKSVRNTILGLGAFIVIISLLSGSWNINFSGVDVLLILFMAALVAAFYQNYFPFLLQNSFSKQGIIKLLLMTSGITSLICAISILLMSLLNNSSIGMPSVIVQSLIQSGVTNPLPQIIYTFCLTLLITVLFLVIILIYLKVGKRWFFTGIVVTYFVLVINVSNGQFKFLLDLFYLIIGYDLSTETFHFVPSIVVNSILIAMLSSLFYMGNKTLES